MAGAQTAHLLDVQDCQDVKVLDGTQAQIALTEADMAKSSLSTIQRQRR
jgi:hypothetical protein